MGLIRKRKPTIEDTKGPLLSTGAEFSSELKLCTFVLFVFIMSSVDDSTTVAERNGALGVLVTIKNVVSTYVNVVAVYVRIGYRFDVETNGRSA